MGDLNALGNVLLVRVTGVDQLDQIPLLLGEIQAKLEDDRDAFEAYRLASFLALSAVSLATQEVRGALGDGDRDRGGSNGTASSAADSDPTSDA